jgi:CheY-like chemotaxis protein
MKILLVDDKVKRRKEIGKILKAQGYQVVCATNGSTAWSQLRLHWVTLVLTDTKMPEMTGPELAAKISLMRNKQPAVIGMSNREESRQLYQYFWNKNAPVEELLKLIKKLTAKSP